jgi:hypothetical protein
VRKCLENVNLCHLSNHDRNGSGDEYVESSQGKDQDQEGRNGEVEEVFRVLSGVDEYREWVDWAQRDG